MLEKREAEQRKGNRKKEENSYTIEREGEVEGEKERERTKRV